jgi:hypothetical protein
MENWTLSPTCELATPQSGANPRLLNNTRRSRPTADFSSSTVRKTRFAHLSPQDGLFHPMVSVVCSIPEEGAPPCRITPPE